ncbi:hypothetical protein [Streptococcus pneumoniae]|nr:hypothetical protein [Streptococcus pneumoniae]
MKLTKSAQNMFLRLYRTDEVSSKHCFEVVNTVLRLHETNEVS